MISSYNKIKERDFVGMADIPKIEDAGILNVLDRWGILHIN